VRVLIGRHWLALLVSSPHRQPHQSHDAHALMLMHYPLADLDRWPLQRFLLQICARWGAVLTVRFSSRPTACAERAWVVQRLTGQWTATVVCHVMVWQRRGGREDSRGGEQECMAVIFFQQDDSDHAIAGPRPSPASTLPPLPPPPPVTAPTPTTITTTTTHEHTRTRTGARSGFPAPDTNWAAPHCDGGPPLA
jgi:hypothetical protein